MKFVLIDQGAAEEIICDRFLQSVEFEPGRALGALLAGQVPKIALNSKLRFVEREGGYFFLSSQSAAANILVIDETTAHLFEGRSDGECLLIFQKLCRFSVRYWTPMRLGANERLIQNSTKAVVFPFPISDQTSYRIVIEREPDIRRLEKRSHGSHLLAYRGNTSEGEGPSELAPLTEFRRALRTLPTVRTGIKSGVEESTAPSVNALRVTELDTGPSRALPPQQGYERWLSLLTEKQKEFVTAPLTVPHRIEGPAGSGKTLTLVLKCICALNAAEATNAEHHALFLAHSDSTRATIQDLFDANGGHLFSRSDRYLSKQSLEVTTLQSLCGKLLNTEISETEFLDRDAMESKNTQLLYVSEAVRETLDKDLPTYSKLLSPDFLKFLTEGGEWTISEMMQHEISVIIKGRAEENLEKYRKIPYINYNMPLRTDTDRGFVFIVFESYQAKLRASAQFDTDDIVLSAAGQLNTPIWRRRRHREGYNTLFVDETHLFNMNELSVLHFLTQNEEIHPIAYSVDRSQSLGDRGWNDQSFDEALSATISATPNPKTLVKSVFRCSPEIVNLAFSVTSSGATLFTNFDNPLKLAASTFTEEEERKSATPTYCSFPNDETMVLAAFSHAESMARAVGTQKHRILIVTFDPVLMEKLSREAELDNKPVEKITRRGDIETLKRAERGGRFVVGLADYVGGLEFDGAVLVGVDNGRVPPVRGTATTDSSNFLSYTAHNKLYVAITRAKFRVEILGTDERGPSVLLSPAFSTGALTKAPRE